jgi:sugar O-acyltransferase (sialic acid O-acetyltransferase NeuD family)
MRPAPLLLIGAGGLAREASAAIRAINEVAPTWQVLGILDDDPILHGTTLGGHEVLGPTEAIALHPSALVLLCFAAPADRMARKRAVAALGVPAERYATIVHPAAAMDTTTEVGAGSIILAGCVATADVTIGAHCILMPNVTLTHDDVLADHVVCGAVATLAGRVQVGEGSYLGSSCAIRQGCWIGAWATIGMGAVVLHDVPVGQVWVGVPAHYLRSIELPMMISP